MELRIAAESSLVECRSPIGAVDDVLDLIAACGENASDRLLIDADWLPESFFDLRSGFAGIFLQKLQNYGIRLAAILPDPESYGERIRELFVEANRGSHFRAFSTREAAESWLSV